MPVDTTYTPGEQLTAADLNGSFAECAAVSGPNTFTDLQTFDNGISVTGGTTTDTLAATGNSTVGGTLGVTGATTLASLGVTGNQTVGGTLTTSGNTSAPAFAATAAAASLAGTTAGTVEYVMPEQGTYKKFVAYANGYENDTTTGQSITFPVAFTNVPVVTTNTSGLTVSVTTTTLTIAAPDVTTTYTGYVIVEGF